MDSGFVYGSLGEVPIPEASEKRESLKELELWTYWEEGERRWGQKNFDFVNVEDGTKDGMDLD